MTLLPLLLVVFLLLSLSEVLMTDLVFLAIGFVAGCLVCWKVPAVKKLLQKMDGGPGNTNTPP